jgi:hypothetical protein
LDFKKVLEPVKAKAGAHAVFSGRPPIKKRKTKKRIAFIPSTFSQVKVETMLPNFLLIN